MEHTIYSKSELSDTEAKRTVCRAIDAGFQFAMDVFGGEDPPASSRPSRCSLPGPHWFDLFRSNSPYYERVIVLQVAPGVFLQTAQPRHGLKGQIGPDISLTLEGELAVLAITEPHWTCTDNPEHECSAQYDYHDAWSCRGSHDGEFPCEISSYRSEIAVVDPTTFETVSFAPIISPDRPVLRVTSKHVAITSATCNLDYLFSE